MEFYGASQMGQMANPKVFEAYNSCISAAPSISKCDIGDVSPLISFSIRRNIPKATQLLSSDCTPHGLVVAHLRELALFLGSEQGSFAAPIGSLARAEASMSEAINAWRT